MMPDTSSYKKSSFGPAFFFLSKRKREALANYYSFCRLMDDIADEPTVKDPAKELNLWKEEITLLYQGKPQTELGKALAEDIREYAIPQDRFFMLIEGMTFDLQGKNYPDFKALSGYLYRVAVIVGLATLDILGVKGNSAKELSESLGTAVQLTNIIRDVHDDALMGRVYLPEDLMAQYGLTRDEVLHGTNPENLAKLLEHLQTLALSYYGDASLLMRKLPRLKMLPCWMMMCVYRANLAKIKKMGFMFTRSVKLTKIEKFKQVLYALFYTFI